MNAAALRQAFAEINVWKRGSERAPHKPLLLLYGLAKCSRGEPRLIPYLEVDRKLLVDFGPARKSYHPEYPFWRLQNDGFWELANAELVEARASNTGAKKSELIRYGVAGGFTEACYDTLRSDSVLLAELAHNLLDENFPTSLHEEILASISLELECHLAQRKKRNPEFRRRVLTAYEFRCAVCGYDVRLEDRALGLEAAHIKWHQAGGPDVESNGLALCVMHHKLFDRGAFGLSPERNLQVSELVNGTNGFVEWLLSYHGQPLRSPQSETYLAGEEFIRWHQAEVFRAPARRNR